MSHSGAAESMLGTMTEPFQGGGDGARGAFWGCCSLPDASFTFQPGASKKEPVSSLEQVLKEVRRRKRRVLG